MRNTAAKCFLVFILFLWGCAGGHPNEIRIKSKASPGSFPIVSKTATRIVIDTNDAKVVQIAANLFSEDIQRVADKKPEVLSNLPLQEDNIIIIGTIGKSRFIDGLVSTGKLKISEIKNQWEACTIAIMQKPTRGIGKALVIAGSDRRGTAFGVFTISEAIGVSPWYYWADVPIQKKKQIYISSDTIIQGAPSVKYRGIFINDEDWGLQPWAAKHFDTDIKDIGPKTYAKVFELLLRLKANYIWPAMHDCTQAFNIYPENKIVADNYAIVMGSSHCEPMLCNNVTEWHTDKMGEWNYETNRQNIYDYWEERVKTNGKYENVYTIGMRGIHDSGIPGGGSNLDKKARLERVIKDQREILSKYVNSDPTQIPQIFCPYKEVLNIYQLGLKVPDDVTIVWPDDNFSYIRNLSTPKEQQRRGHSGIYYHLSYWGTPQDYLWIGSTSPAQISYEMSKAYAYGADKLWVFNVGDIKPLEMETDFALRLAYDINSWPVEKSMDFIEDWCSKTFGDKYVKEIAEIHKEYYRLTQEVKPEHVDRVSFSEQKQNARLADYKRITDKAEEIYFLLAPEYKDAFFQLILYPVKGAGLMEQKHTYTVQGKAELALKAYNEIQDITNYYNKKLAGGKWDGIMDASPRNTRVFRRPDIRNIKKVPADTYDEPDFVFAADEYSKINNTKISKWCKVEGLGIEDCAMILLPYKTESIREENSSKAPTITYSFKSNAGKCDIETRFLPTHRINEGMGLRFAISVDGQPAQFGDINTSSITRTWEQNVLRGYSSIRTKHDLKNGNNHKITIYLLDPGMVLSQIRIFKIRN